MIIKTIKTTLLLSRSNISMLSYMRVGKDKSHTDDKDDSDEVEDFVFS